MNSRIISKVISSILFVLSLVAIVLALSRIKAKPPTWDFELVCLKYNTDSTILRDIIPAWNALCNMELINSLQYNAMAILLLLALGIYVIVYILNLGRWYNSILMFLQLLALVPLIQSAICLCINSQKELVLMALSAVLVGVLGVMFVLALPLALVPHVYSIVRRSCIAFAVVFSIQLKQQIIVYGTVNLLIQLEMLLFALIAVEVVIEILTVIGSLLKHERNREDAENFQ